MRVTMLVRTLAMMRGGGETRHLAWARELTSLGVDVELVTARPLVARPRYAVSQRSGSASAAPLPRVTMLRTPYLRNLVYRFQKRRGFGRLTMAALYLDDELFCRAAWRHIARSQPRPDAVHAHALHQAGRLRTIDVPVVVNLPGEPNARETRDLTAADALVADGWAAETLPARLNRPVDCVPKGVDSQTFTPSGSDMRGALGLEGKSIVLTIARLVPIKNVMLLIEAFAIVRAELPRAHLVIVGDGPEGQALRSRAMALEIADSVTFAGAVPHEQTPAYYRSADVFALSSDFDNSPNVVLEAMACGLPVVATDAGGARAFVADRTGGVLVPRGDAAALARAVAGFLTSRDAARQAGAFNRARASRDFSWRASATRLLDVYRRLVATPATAV